MDSVTESPQVIYLPPSDTLIEQYAHAVCKELGETANPAYDTFEVRLGFAEFLKVVTKIYAAQQNRNSSSAA